MGNLSLWQGEKNKLAYLCHRDIVWTYDKNF